jgi:UDPglucose 6-dehydrogenase
MATIIGDGTVGKALGINIGVKPLGPGDSKVMDNVIIICVPTETIDGKQDLSAVRDALSRIDDTHLVIIRSTILPGTTDELQKECKFPIMFVPEFGREKFMVEDLGSPELYVFGYTDKSIGLVNMARAILPVCSNITVVKARAAELSKYFCNVTGATLISLANTFYDWAGDDYDEALKAARLFPTFPKWGFNIYDQGKRGYRGKCLPKDTKAMLSAHPNKLIQAVEDINESL